MDTIAKDNSDTLFEKKYKMLNGNKKPSYKKLPSLNN